MKSYEVVVIHGGGDPVVISPANVVIKKFTRDYRYVSPTVAFADRDTKAEVLKETVQMIRGLERRLIALQGLSPRVVNLVGRLIAAVEAELKRRENRRRRRRQDGDQPGDQPLA
jgi:hypothetical protein